MEKRTPYKRIPKKIDVNKYVEDNRHIRADEIAWASIIKWFDANEKIELNEESKRKFMVIFNHVMRLPQDKKMEFIHKWK